MLHSLLVALTRAMHRRCPRCGVGALFAAWFRMHENCPECGIHFEREPGYFVGAIYINYGLTVLIAIAGSFLLEYRLDVDVRTQLPFWAAFTVLFPLFFFPFSKSLWLCIEYALTHEDRTPPLRRVR